MKLERGEEHLEAYRGQPLWKYLREWRKMNDLPQIEVARRAGVSLPTYILWETGGTKLPNEKNLRKLEEVTGLPLRYLLGLEDTKEGGGRKK